MKKFTAAAAVLLAAILLAGCSLPLNMSLSPTPAPKKLTRGIVEDSVYTSEYSELTFTAPAGWAYATDEMIAAKVGIGVEISKDAGLNFSEEALSKQNVYDMMAQDPATNNSVIVAYENLAMVPGGTNFTEVQYLNQLKLLMARADIVDFEFSDITKEKLGSHEFSALAVSMPDLNVTEYYYVRRIDNYMLAVIIAVFSGDISDISPCFS